MCAQVARLTKQYEEIAALAAAAGLQLEDPLNNSTPAAAAGAKQGAPAAPAAAGAKEEAAAASKGPQPKAVEIAEGDRKVGSVCGGGGVTARGGGSLCTGSAWGVHWCQLPARGHSVRQWKRLRGAAR
jgi:hypothetical protein